MHIHRLGYITCLLLTLFVCNALSAQTTRSHNDSLHRPIIHKIGFDIRPNYVTPTADFLKGENSQQEPVRKYLSAHLKYAFQFSKDSRLGKLYPHAYQGIGVSYGTFFNTSEVGNPLALYVFQGSRIKQLSPNLSLDYEWNFGASFGWKKYDEQTNSYNNIVGSKINAYINLGLFLNWKFNPQWNLTAGLDFTHFSNGNTNFPNGGVNPVGARIGIVHTFGAEDANASAAGIGKARPIGIVPHVSYDLVVYGATRKRGFIKGSDAYLVPGAFGIVGLNFNPMYNFNKFFKAGASLDLQFDESANIEEYLANSSSHDPKFYHPPFREQFAAGLSIRGELVLPIFSINIGLGHNVLYKGNDTKDFYQILALKTSLTRNLFLHVGYQLSNFKDPNNLMLGLGYRFHNKR